VPSVRRIVEIDQRQIVSVVHDIEMLPAFLLIRGMALIGWFHQRPEHAGSDFFEEMKTWVLKECGRS